MDLAVEALRRDRIVRDGCRRVGIGRDVGLGHGAAVVVRRRRFARGGALDGDRAFHPRLLMTRDRADEREALGRDVDLDRPRLAAVGVGGLAAGERDVVGDRAGVGQGDLIAAGRRDAQLRRLEPEVEGVDLERPAGRGRGGRGRCWFVPRMGGRLARGGRIAVGARGIGPGRCLRGAASGEQRGDDQERDGEEDSGAHVMRTSV